jgi:UDP-N-acetylmuramoylalanine--D-glutamate ligase
VRIIVIGARKSGIYAALLAKKKGNDVFLTEKSDNYDIRENLSLLNENNIPYEIGYHSFDKLDNAQLAIVSPGVPSNSQILLEIKKRHIKLIGEMEYAYSQSTGTKVIAITGTNGKSTTTALIGHVLKGAGLNVVTGGNLGIPYSQLLIENPNPAYAVLETSCFQLETIEFFHPYIAAFLNLAEDHLDRYANMDEYLYYKERIFENQTEADFAIINYEDQILKGVSRRLKSSVYYFSTNSCLKHGAFLSNEKIFFSDLFSEEILERKNIPLIGLHNIKNVLVAIIVSKILNLENEVIKQGIESFIGLPHRLEPVREINGVLYINDSKSTTPDSTIKALEALDSKIVLIAGGSSKNNNFDELAKLFKEKLRKLILIGETAKEISKSFASFGFDSYMYADTLENAVKIASREAHKGDIILLSPACASFDMFRDFEDRGDQFKEIVRNI